MPDVPGLAVDAEAVPKTEPPVVAEQLVFADDKHAVTASGMVGIVMLVHPRQGEDRQFFEYVRHVYAEVPDRVEWDKDTMNAVVSAAAAKYLIGNGWARAMTGSEVRAYNRWLKEREKETSK